MGLHVVGCAEEGLQILQGIDWRPSFDSKDDSRVRASSFSAHDFSDQLHLLLGQLELLDPEAQAERGLFGHSPDSNQKTQKV
jgi:hypothetical protein